MQAVAVMVCTMHARSMHDACSTLPSAHAHIYAMQEELLLRPSSSFVSTFLIMKEMTATCDQTGISFSRSSILDTMSKHPALHLVSKHARYLYHTSSKILRQQHTMLYLDFKEEKFLHFPFPCHREQSYCLHFSHSPTFLPLGREKRSAPPLTASYMWRSG